MRFNVWRLVIVTLVAASLLTGCKKGQDENMAAPEASATAATSREGAVLGVSAPFKVGDCIQVRLRQTPGYITVACDAPHQYQDPDKGHTVLAPVLRVMTVIPQQSTGKGSMCPNPDAPFILDGGEASHPNITYCLQKLPK